ncbi:transposase [Planctomicrobium sp. SH668]|uniref:transposase n=1 Tax=Planctomicrobium sp. SH668 TaxID=3448126 RepID=UPI003F5B771A
MFEHITHDLREVARVAQGRDEPASATILDARVIQSTPESGARAGYDGGKRRKGSKVHLVSNTETQNDAETISEKLIIRLHYFNLHDCSFLIYSLLLCLSRRLLPNASPSLDCTS